MSTSRKVSIGARWTSRTTASASISSNSREGQLSAPFSFLFLFSSLVFSSPSLLLLRFSSLLFPFFSSLLLFCLFSSLLFFTASLLLAVLFYSLPFASLLLLLLLLFSFAPFLLLWFYDCALTLLLGVSLLCWMRKRASPRRPTRHS